MLRTIEGIFRDGKVELLELPPTQQTSRVVVTFLAPETHIDLPQRSITSEEAADLRARLRPFAEDWDRPEMSIYDEL